MNIEEQFKYLKNNFTEFYLGLKNKDIKQIPNLLTLSRLFSPITIIPLVLSGNLLLAGIAVGIFGITDLLDGFLARKLNAKSEFGTLLDAFTDKVFVLSLIVPLAVLNPVFWISVLFEITIGLVNVNSKINGNNPKTIFIGKVKTACLFLLMSLGYLSNFFSLNSFINALTIGTGILQLTCIDKYIKINREKNNEKRKEIKKIEFENNKKSNTNDKRKYEELREYLFLLQKDNELNNQNEIKKVKVLKKRWQNS